MHRFYIAPEIWNADALALTGSELHHARDVLRIKPGDKAILFNGQGREVTGEVVDLGRDEIRLRKLHETQTPLLQCRITLGQAIPKGKNMDLIVQKATELGAAVIEPLLSERTVIQCDANDAAKKREKWQSVAIEAAKQCGQNWLPSIQRPQTPKEFFNAGQRFDLTLIASLQSGALHLKNILAEQPKRPKTVLILVGPEGDFTPAEIALAKSYGCRPITLGPIVLRTETAALYCLSVLSYELLSDEQ
jgi:16S rRNA (uracil1498-N3)-methyltransferase